MAHDDTEGNAGMTIVSRTTLARELVQNIKPEDNQYSPGDGGR